MTKDELREQADRTFNMALEYLVEEGWPTRAFDEQAADRIYAAWLTDTQSIWETSGYRYRDPLREALESYFTQRYGNDDGLARVVVYALLLETRARREGHTHRDSPA